MAEETEAPDRVGLPHGAPSPCPGPRAGGLGDPEAPWQRPAPCLASLPTPPPMPLPQKAPAGTPFPDAGEQVEGGSGLGSPRLWHRHWCNWFGPSPELRAGRAGTLRVPDLGCDSLSRCVCVGGGSVTHGPEPRTSQPGEASGGQCASRWAVPACPAHLSHVPGAGPRDLRRGSLLKSAHGRTQRDARPEGWT